MSAGENGLPEHEGIMMESQNVDLELTIFSSLGVVPWAIVDALCVAGQRLNFAISDDTKRVCAH